MILGTARTGSNLLLSLLSSHPSIKTYGELFNLDSLPRENLLETLADPTLLLRRKLYQPHRPGIAAVGFKMFYDHLTKSYFEKPLDFADSSPQWLENFQCFVQFVESNYSWPTLLRRFQSVWDFLVADQYLAILHLKRRNALQTLISLKQAFKTDHWWNLRSEAPTSPAVHINPDECLRYFETIDALADEADRAFAAHPKLDVFYEDLAEKQEPTLDHIFAFLRVPHAPAKTRMRKQNLAPAWETVDNYDQLREYFRDSKWRIFFEGQPA